jgi:hypothetical protein
VVHTTGTHTGDGLGFPPTGKRFDPRREHRRGPRRQGLGALVEPGTLAMLQQLGVVPQMGPPQPA